MPAINDILDGRYQIISKIGVGGAGVVFLGYHLTLHKYVVVKKLKEQVTEHLNIRGEADILKQLHHRYLPQVYDFLVIDNDIFTVMDYVDGHDLKWYVENGIIFSEPELVRMLLQLCEVLEYLHGQRPPIIHRDIKPGNIMIREDGDVCLIDFNISFSEENRMLAGYSYAYAPPEQIEMSKAAAYGGRTSYVPDARTDIYSLGATFFYLMTGLSPRDARAGHLKKGGARTAYSAELFRIIKRAMEADPKKRYPSAARMKRAVERGTGRAGRLLPALVLTGITLTLILGIMAGYFHNQNKREAVFAAAYSSYVSQLATGDPQAWIREGIGLLNQSDIAGQLEKKPKQKEVILEGIADGYFEEENYRAAADYYKEALSLQTDPGKKAEAMRDLIICLVRSGNAEEARQTLAAYQSDISSEVLQYLEVEFLLQEGRREEALSEIDRLLAGARDSDILLRCCLYGAECLEGTKEYERRMTYLKQAEQYLSTSLLYRRIGEGFFKIVQEEPEEAVSRAALDRAEQCYEKLCAGSWAGYVDRLNLAMIKRLQEEYDSAMELLQELIGDFPEDYRAYCEAAFTRYGMEQKKAAPNRSSLPVFYYGELAFQHYDETANDERMIQLKELMEYLSAE